MQSTLVNDLKIYDLTSGKSVPEWLNSRKKRKLLKSDAALRNRIQLLQDFEMPGVSNCIKMSPDGQFIVATGTYKPRMRCYDTSQLGLKFERCFDHEVLKFLFLSEDYSKLVFLQDDRWIEIHNQAARYFSIRVPKAGHDIAYCKSTCDLAIVGEGSAINRLNLEVGKYLEPLATESSSLNACAVNDVHELFVCGSKEGTVDAVDFRCGKIIGKLDCALSCVTPDTNVEGMPSVTSLAFRDSMNLAVGTATGQILLYDMRSSKPYLVKDHYYGLPIKTMTFIPSMDLVASLDQKIVKIWSRVDGKPYTAIQTQSDLNDLHIVPKTGMLFLANEDKKMLSYYLPALGPAPKWASFLDRIVEELEESTSNNAIYEDFKFVTEKELNELGLEHLIGTNLLRAYMHGFFLDMKLYNKAKSLSQSYAYEEYKKKKIRDKLESERGNRVVIKSKLPSVNRDLAVKLLRKQGMSVISDDEEDEDEDEYGQKEEQVGDKGDGYKESKLSDLGGSWRNNNSNVGDDDVNGQDDLADTSLPSVTSSLKKKKNKKGTTSINLLADERFKALFQNRDFQVDPNSSEYRSMVQKDEGTH